MSYIGCLEVISRNFVITVKKEKKEKVLETLPYADTKFDM